MRPRVLAGAAVAAAALPLATAIHYLTRRPRGRATDGDDGLLMIQIDGLALPVLERALAEGRMPALARHLREGSHRLAGWECSLPSQTSASQAGILYGDNFDIPAFRWYEKESRRLLVSDHPLDAAEIARRASTGEGLLSGAGSSMSNLLAGDAEHSFLTMSTFADSRQSAPRRVLTFYGFFLSPFGLARVAWLMLWETVTELYEGRMQALRRLRPRVHRGLSVILLRAVSSVLLRELDVYLVRHDLAAGVPVIYCDFVGYDVVAHHAGPQRAETLRVLGRLDREIAAIERSAAKAPRRYHLVVLSDHGQSQGATFLQRRGRTLEELVEELMGEEYRVHGSRGRGEGLGHLSAVLSEFVRLEHVLRPVLGFLLGRREGGRVIGLVRGREMPEEEPHAVVCASGNLGLIYVTSRAGRVSLERIEAAYPDLVDGLRREPGIGFVLAHSERTGPLVLGRAGRRYLAEDHVGAAVEGEDPLASFGPHAAAALRRLDSFPHCGDLAVNSLLDPITDGVASFEELAGSHGGLGGPQTAPFLIFPAEWELPAGRIEGAPAVHAVLRRWLERLPPGKIDRVSERSK